MVSLERALCPLMFCAVCVSCAESSSPNPPESAELRFSSPLVIAKEADSVAKVFVGDANADSWLDVLTWGEGAPYVNVAIPEQGLSQPFKLAGLPTGPIRQAVWLDLTGDLSADALVLDDSGQLRRFHSDSVDEYSEHTLGLPQAGPIAAFAVLDLNRDERLDFVVLGESAGADAGAVAPTRLEVLFGAGGGKWTSAQVLEFEPTEAGSEQQTPFLQPTDINGDERWDIVVGVPGFGVGWLEQLAPSGADAGLALPEVDAGADAEAPADLEPELFRYVALEREESDTSAALFIDYDNDGDVDYFRFAAESDVQVSKNDGAGEFDSNVAKGLAPGALGCIEDFDNDGRLDVLSVADDVVLKLGTSKANTFADGLELGEASNLPIASLACVDVDNDGDVDVLTGGSKGTGLYLNRLEPLTADLNNYFDFRLAGTSGNAAALGTSIEFVFGKKTVHRLAFASGHAFLPASPSLHIGLGSAILLDSVTITWPNGESEKATDWTVNDTVTATQPE
jgi:hypothetical protein